MELEKIEALITQFEDSDLRELKIDDGDFHFYLSKNKNRPPQVLSKPTSTAKTSKKTKTKVAKSPQTNLKAVNAPLVGVAYLQAKPGKPAFVKVGDHVKKGDTICVIEAMKMMTEVKSDLTGTVKEIKVENEDLVEVGQPLIMVEED